MHDGEHLYRSVRALSDCLKVILNIAHYVYNFFSMQLKSGSNCAIFVEDECVHLIFSMENGLKLVLPTFYGAEKTRVSNTRLLF